MLSVRSLSVAALLLAGIASAPALATAPDFIRTAVAAGPYDNDYDQGHFSGDTYVSCTCRSVQDVEGEKSWAENQQQSASDLHQYYYLQGYIDRLTDYLNWGV